MSIEIQFLIIGTFFSVIACIAGFLEYKILVNMEPANFFYGKRVKTYELKSKETFDIHRILLRISPRIRYREISPYQLIIGYIHPWTKIPLPQGEFALARILVKAKPFTYPKEGTWIYAEVRPVYSLNALPVIVFFYIFKIIEAMHIKPHYTVTIGQWSFSFAIGLVALYCVHPKKMDVVGWIRTYFCAY